MRARIEPDYTARAAPQRLCRSGARLFTRGGADHCGEKCQLTKRMSLDGIAGLSRCLRSRSAGPECALDLVPKCAC